MHNFSHHILEKLFSFIKVLSMLFQALNYENRLSCIFCKMKGLREMLNK